MALQDIYRGMENGVETINQNFKQVVQTTGNETILGTKNFKDGLQVNGNRVLTVDDQKKKIYTLSMTDVPDASITELKGELVREADHVSLQCRVNCSAGTNEKTSTSNSNSRCD